MRKLAALTLVPVITFLTAPMALAKGGSSGPNLQYRGILTAISVDGDPATPDTMTLDTFKANGPGRQCGSGSITVRLTPATRFDGEENHGESSDDYRVGDGVEVRSVRDPDCSSLRAVRVRLDLFSFEGTLVSFDQSGGTASMQWSEADKFARKWLSMNGNPNPVSFLLTGDTRVDGQPQAGDQAEVKARASASDPAQLEAVKVESISG